MGSDNISTLGNTTTAAINKLNTNKLDKDWTFLTSVQSGGSFTYPASAKEIVIYSASAIDTTYGVILSILPIQILKAYKGTTNKIILNYYDGNRSYITVYLKDIDTNKLSLGISNATIAAVFYR